MLDPKTVVVMTPSHHGEVCTGFCSGLIQCGGLYGGHAFISGMSEINLARNLMVNAFLNLPEQFEWMVCIDSDLEFSRQDFEYLCEDHNIESGDTDHYVNALAPTHLIVSAEYPRRPIKCSSTKKLGPAKLAVGFARIHRSVFAALREIAHTDGTPLVGSFFREGEVLHDYFPTGAQGDGHWLSEDHGFFRLCQIAEIVPRIETRTRLIHWGRHGEQYVLENVSTPQMT